ncbi:MAG: hypothetical protein DRP06_03095 [Candidatus Aenigmatarchaeota archaeon]|nr:MAG: hypothetical protein DRP06_03095 [Candidatus Aenigmarchaeota archaeon]
MDENRYNTPETAILILQDYCDRDNFYFIANKINLANKYRNLTITEGDMECASKLFKYSWLNIGTDHRNKRDWERAIQNNYKFYLYKRREIIQILVELKRGISTPLKFTFQPEEPFNPMKISSINEGDTSVSICFFRKFPK